MAKRRVEEEIEQIGSLRNAEPTETTALQLRKALNDKVNLMVAKAAAVAGDLQMTSLVPELLAAYERMFQNPVKSDPQCWGKTAIAKALKKLGYAQGAPFSGGVHYRQMEPVWGGEEDSAATLRGTCLLALLQCTDVPAQTILSCLVDASADLAAPVRRDAVEGLEQWGSPEAVLLLRMKARLGDEDPAITGMVFDALLRLEQAGAVEFLASFLDHKKEELREEAALALGSSKVEQAVAILIERCRKQSVRNELWIRALGTSRLPSAFEFLLETVRLGRLPDATAALRALEARRENEEAWNAIAAAVASRTDPDLQEIFAKQFPRPGEP